MQSMMGDRSYFKINMDKTVHTNRIQEKFQKQTWLLEDKNEMQSKFTTHIYTM